MAVAIATLCLAFPGCGVPPQPPQPAPPRGRPGFAIRYERSGGLRATYSRLRIRRGRHAIATTDNPRSGRRTVRFRVGRKRVRSLRRGLRRAHFGKLKPPPAVPCADCYFYKLAYRGKRLAFSGADIPARLRGVIDQLEAIVAAHATPANS